MNRPIVWFLMGILAAYIYFRFVAKVPMGAMTPGNGNGR